MIFMVTIFWYHCTYHHKIKQTRLVNSDKRLHINTYAKTSTYTPFWKYFGDPESMLHFKIPTWTRPRQLFDLSIFFSSRFCPIFILCMGVLTPMTSGIVSSAVIAGLYKAAGIKMAPLYAMFWGVGQTLLSAAVGFTRILATL